MPIKLLHDRAMLLTRPSFTGSWLAMKTMGIVVVAALAAKGPRVHRGRVTELSSRRFGVLCAEAALNAASTFHRSAVVDRVNIKSMPLHGSCRLMCTKRHCARRLILCPESKEVRTPIEGLWSPDARLFLATTFSGHDGWSFRSFRKKSRRARTLTSSQVRSKKINHGSDFSGQVGPARVHQPGGRIEGRRRHGVARKDVDQLSVC